MSPQEETQDCDTFNGKRWYAHWRHLAAYVFIIICLFDFIIMPVYFEMTNTIDVNQAVEQSLKYTDPNNRIMSLRLFVEKRTWQPLTLGAGGTFFMAFGGILGVAAWTRGQEKMGIKVEPAEQQTPRRRRKAS